ncbi:MAG: hypothetical protein ABI343_14435 [Burkholderiaceae bacterium]
MRFSFLSALATSLLVLSACSSYGPPASFAGVTRDQLVARMGPPEMRRAMADGSTRLEYPSGPYGRQTWFVYLDAAGNPIRSEQVLNEKHFLQIAPGMTEAEVRARLGRPGEVLTLGRDRGKVWSYRYENPFCQWFQVEISAEHIVRSAGYGEPPECDRRGRIRIPG